MDFLEFLITFFFADRLAAREEQEDDSNRLKRELDDLRDQVEHLKAKKDE